MTEDHPQLDVTWAKNIMNPSLKARKWNFFESNLSAFLGITFFLSVFEPIIPAIFFFISLTYLINRNAQGFSMVKTLPTIYFGFMVISYALRMTDGKYSSYTTYSLFKPFFAN